MQDDPAARQLHETRFLHLFFFRVMQKEKSKDAKEKSVHAKDLPNHATSPRMHAKDSRHDDRNLVQDNRVRKPDNPDAPVLRETRFLLHLFFRVMHEDKRVDNLSVCSVHPPVILRTRPTLVMHPGQNEDTPSVGMENPSVILRKRSAFVPNRRVDVHKPVGVVDKDDVVVRQTGNRCLSPDFSRIPTRTPTVAS